jgi:hypothetical protein
MPPKTKAVKANIDKYIFLFSKHASKQSYTDTNGIVRNIEYGWNIEPQTINEQSTLELVQKDFSNYGEETATAVVNVLTTSTANVTVTNAITNGYYTTPPAVSFTGTGIGLATGTAVLTSGRVTGINVGGTMSGLLIPTSVVSITVGVGGTGYNVIPNVSFTGGGIGSGASATAVLTAGVVTSITLSNSIGTGLNYTSAPTVVIDPPATGAIQALGTVVYVSASSITVTVSNPTTNGYYTSAPTVTFTGGTGTGAIGTAVLTSGRVTSVTMSGTMSGYAAGTLPTVSFAAPSGTQATATCTVGGAITATIAAPTTLGITPYMIRINNLHSGSIIHSTDDGGTGNTIKKGMIIDMSYPFQDITEAIKMVLEQQTINRIVISVDNTFSEIKGLPITTDFVLCFKLAEYEPKPLSYGSMDNVNVNQR